MIDGVRLNFSNGESLLNNLKDSIYKNDIIMGVKFLEETDTGYRYMNKDGLNFRIGKLNYIRGSLHKWHNVQIGNDDNNYSDFTYSQNIDAIDRLEKIVGKTDINISRLEIGFNIKVDFSIENFIKNNVVFYKKESHSELNTFKGNGLLKRFKKSKYDIKIYDKGKQYNLIGENSQLLRIEVVYKTSSELKKLKIKKLSDLKNKAKLRNLFVDFLKKFDSITIVDSLPRELNSQNQCLFFTYTNPIYWEGFLKDISSSYKHRKFREFNSLISELQLLNLKSSIRDLLKEKYVYLINN